VLGERECSFCSCLCWGAGALAVLDFRSRPKMQIDLLGCLLLGRFSRKLSVWQGDVPRDVCWKNWSGAHERNSAVLSSHNLWTVAEPPPSPPPTALFPKPTTCSRQTRTQTQSTSLCLSSSVQPHIQSTTKQTRQRALQCMYRLGITYRIETSARLARNQELRRCNPRFVAEANRWFVRRTRVSVCTR
jgi:hypothetical protein